MDNLVFILNDDKKSNKSILEFYPELNQNQPNSVKLILMEDLPHFLENFSVLGGNFLFQGYIFAPKKVYQFFYDDHALITTEIKARIFNNPFENALKFMNQLNKNPEGETIRLDQTNKMEISSEKYNIWRGYLEKFPLIKSQNFINLDKIRSKYEFISQYVIYQNKYKSNQINRHEYICYLTNLGNELSKIEQKFLTFYIMETNQSSQIHLLSEIFRSISLNSYFAETDQLPNIVNYILKSLKYKNNEFDVMKSLDFFMKIIYDNSTVWDLGIPKIIAKILNNTSYNIELLSDKEINTFLSILITMKIYFGDEKHCLEFLKIIKTRKNPLTLYLMEKFEELYLFDISKIDEFSNLEDLYQSFIKKSNNKIIIHNENYRDLIRLENFMEFYKDVLTQTRLNPDDLTIGFNLSNYIRENIELVKFNLIDEMQNQLKIPIFNYFEDLIIFTEILFSDLHNKQKLKRLLLIIRKVVEDDSAAHYSLIPRLLLFCVDNFSELDNEQILEVTKLNSDKTYLTVPRIIGNLLECLVNNITLTDQDIYYLNNYLGHEINDYTQEAISDLVISLIQMERKPQMLINYDQENGNTVVTKVRISDKENNNHQGAVLSEKSLSFIPEVLVDLIVDYTDLMNYVEMYVEYQIVNSEWKEHDGIEKPYQQVKNMQTVMKSLQKYLKTIRSMRRDHPQIVDDITLDFLEIEMLIENQPEFTISKLRTVEQKLHEVNVIKDDWSKYHKFSGKAYNQLGLEYQIQK